MTHLPEPALRAYASPRGGLAAGATWTVEAHLETCSDCRVALSAVLDDVAPDTARLIGLVGERLATGLDIEPATRRRRRFGRWRRWLTPAMAPALQVTVLVIITALALDALDTALDVGFPSLLLLIAPVAPLAAVAAAWAPGLDPAHELVASSPRAGLDLVLRRTLVVLAVVVPVLAISGMFTGLSPALWLLPCLALTVGALALGPVLGPARASLAVVGLWAIAVVSPSLVLREPPSVLDPANLPAWVAALAAAGAILAIRRRAYVRAGGF